MRQAQGGVFSIGVRCSILLDMSELFPSRLDSLESQGRSDEALQAVARMNKRAIRLAEIQMALERLGAKNSLFARLLKPWDDISIARLKQEKELLEDQQQQDAMVAQ